MSHDPRGRPYGAPGMSDRDEDEDSRKGSVRAARQRLQAAQSRNKLPDTSKIIGLPQRPNQLVSQYSSQSSTEQRRAAQLSATANTTSPPPQWPLPNNSAAGSSSPAIPPRSPKRLQPPRQDNRPTSDDFPIQQLSPGYAQPAPSNRLQPTSPGYNQFSPSDDMFSPTSHQSSRPITTSSVLSESSSLGSIPDFPVPQPPMPSISSANSARRIPIGPPPSARRGPSSYYTQMSYVSPIAEESDTRSDTVRGSRTGSFASSNVFPTRRDYYPADDVMSDDDSTITSERGPASPYEQDDSRGLVEQSPALVRQASLGRRTKPSLMTIKSIDSLGDRKGAGKTKSEGVRSGVGTTGAAGAMFASNAATQGQFGAEKSVASSLSSSSESLSSMKRMQELTAATFGQDQSLARDTRPTTLAERAGMRRPPKLDMDAVRDAEARGSLTSLPELIRRATRLAANLDRGKTASRLGLDFWEAGAPERKDTRQSGLSDMLAAFPPPGQDTPGHGGTPNNGMSKWPSAGSRYGKADSRMSDEKDRRRRRCCGMPLWTFVTLMIVLLFMIAAAIVIPVVLIVIPNMNKSNNLAAQEGQGNSNNGNNNDGNSGSNGGNGNTRPALPAPTLAPGGGGAGVNGQCDGVITCQNGGISILNSDRTCNCVCINGFTGRTCTTNDATGCTTTNVAGAASNATVGTAISRLLGSNADGFNIPLDSTRVLSLFSTLSLSCPAQNALITFNGLASRSDTRHLLSVDVDHALEPSKSLPILHQPHPPQAPELKLKRQAIGGPGRPDVTKAEESSPTPTIPVSSNRQALDFARVGVLFALQESGNLETAAKAQESIQSFLTDNRNGNSPSSSINMGPFKMDLVQLSITLNNGTVIRAAPLPSPST